MVDQLDLTPQQIRQLTDQQPRRYAFGNDDENRSESRARSTIAQERRAIERLNRFLASGEEPQTNVPRGHYLNIQV